MKLSIKKTILGLKFNLKSLVFIMLHFTINILFFIFNYIFILVLDSHQRTSFPPRNFLG